MLIMSLMKKVARKHGFRCLLHEKPFDGVNGSGKHNNWSLSTDNGILLHAPAKDEIGNLRFVTFVVETLMGVYKHNGLLKASIMSATNAHRLGANEAPPAIVSSFLGKQLTEILDHLENTKDDSIAISAKSGLKLDIPSIPELLIDNTDRNRTSPFAFTGNRFEFRAVGSEANCASAMIALNSAVAEALVDFKKRVDARIEEFKGRPEFAEGTGHTAKYHAIVSVLREDIKTCKAIRFDGNGYSDEWVEEATKRGLDVEKSCPKIFDRYLDKESIQMFESLGVMTKKELEARNEIKWETYTKKITKLAQNVAALKTILPEDEFKTVAASNLALISEISQRVKTIEEGCLQLTEARKVANKIASEREKAIAYHDTVEPLMGSIRYHIDKLEAKVDDEVWTLPKYRELLFIR